MLYLLVLLPILVAAALAYLASQPAEFLIRRSLAMNADAGTCFARVRDLRGWADWSPWSLHDPAARLAYSPHPDQEGGYYSWDGQRIGAGRLTHERLTEPTRIDQRIRFIRPFKTENAVWWEFAAAPDGTTEVTWSMRAHLPFPLRFLTPLMTRMMEYDFELGLARLRGILDPSAERPEVRFLGPLEHPAQTALTIPYSGDLAGLIATMGDGLPRLGAHCAAMGVTPPGPAFMAYHKVNAKVTRLSCDLALPVPAGTDPGPFALKRLGGGRYYGTELQGSYQFLGPAWSAVMAHLRMVRARRDRSRPSLEIYVKDPSQTSDSNEYLTRILVPIR